MLNATDANFDDLIKDKLVLVDFYAVWCGPCSMQAEELERLSSSRKDDGYEIIKVNIDENIGLASRFNVSSIPTLMLFKNGKKLTEHVGYMKAEELNSIIEENKDAD